MTLQPTHSSSPIPNEENTYGFETPSKPACKHLWKCCVEHHAFFRLVQVSPTTPDIFALGSKFRYSGRTEKQAQRDAQMRLRSPPHVGSLYRSTCSIPAVLPSHGRADSPRSTRSAPWTQPHMRGLYTSSSPRSVRSAGNNSQLLNRLTRRSSSVESQSSNDSRSCKKHHHHRSRRGSDNDSELSKCSGKSHGHRRHRHRSHGNKRDSGSEQDQHHRHRHKSSSRHSSRPSGSHYELVDSEAQWREVQRKQAEGGTGIHQATVTTVGNRRSGYMNSGMETESEQSYHHKRKHKKHRSRSRSPSETKARLPDELKKHLEFDLIDTEGMSDAQLREIPYKVVETNNKTLRVKLSPNAKRSQRSPRRTKSASTQDERCPPPSNGDSPPPPYSPPQNQNNPTPTNNSETRKSSDNLAGPEDSKRPSESPIIYNGLADIINKHSASSSASQSPAGSLRTRSGHCNDNTNNNIINTASNNNNNHLPRLSSSQYQDYRNISHRTHSSRAFSSALYDNPGTLLGKANGLLAPHINKHQHNNINNTVCHEHSDSGLSAGSQDYSSYVTDRSSEGPKYAQTTKLPTSLSSSLQHSPLPSLVSSTGTTSRGYPFNSMRLPPAGLPHTPVNRHWDMAWGSVYSSPSQPDQGTYRTMPCNANNNWSGGGYGGGGRNSTCNSRGPLYFTHHNTSSSSSTHNVLRDSNKFNTRGRTDATRQGRSGDGDPALQRRSRSASLELILSPIIQSTLHSSWCNDPETIREDDESLEQTGSDTSPYKITNNNNQQHPNHRANGHEVTHEMSTEL
uniref:FERM adjacent domain-containing protein n=1 Tax=Timema monikensis TaxID=170555 RepID=A0A7R9HNT9_9NEOP|nr:unnamed protein product [Timema monikensis]